MKSFSISSPLSCALMRRSFEQHLLERALLLRGLLAELPHQRVGFGAPHFFGERKRHRLGHDLSAGQFKIGTQALDVDLKTLCDLDHGAERART